jgi:proteasome accessory factor A
MLESGGTMRDHTLENPIRAIREISHDLTGSRAVKLANGRSLSAWQIQTEYFERCERFAEASGLAEVPRYAQVLDLWRRTLAAIAAGDPGAVGTEVDWVIKHQLLERYMAKHDLTWGSPRIAQLDLAYHDISRTRGLFNLLEQRGMAARIADEIEVFAAKTVPPQTTRARLRGEFIAAAQAKRRDFTVDWVHLKLNDQAQRTVLCKDPFRAVDERVQRLIESM